MTEARQADKFALVCNGRGGAWKSTPDDAGAQDIKRTPETWGLCGEIARYQAVSNLVQRCP